MGLSPERTCVGAQVCFVSQVSHTVFRRPVFRAVLVLATGSPCQTPRMEIVFLLGPERVEVNKPALNINALQLQHLLRVFHGEEVHKPEVPHPFV
jgi:hypothetical protein